MLQHINEFWLLKCAAWGDPLVLCFVDFLSPAHAATSMDALQGELKCSVFPPLEVSLS